MQSTTIPVPGHTAQIQVSVDLRREGATTVATFKARHLHRRGLHQVAFRAPGVDALPEPTYEARTEHTHALRWELEGGVVIELLIFCHRDDFTSSASTWERAPQAEAAPPTDTAEAAPSTEAKAQAPKRRKKEPAAEVEAPEPPAST